MENKKQILKKNSALDVEEFLDRLRTFIEKRSISKDGDYAPVTKEDIDSLDSFIQEMLGLRFDSNSDDDLPIQFKLIDRTKFENMAYSPLRYQFQLSSSEEFLNLLKIAQMNVTIANDRFDSLWKAFCMFYNWELKKKDEKDETDNA